MSLRPNGHYKRVAYCMRATTKTDEINLETERKICRKIHGPRSKVKNGIWTNPEIEKLYRGTSTVRVLGSGLSKPISLDARWKSRARRWWWNVKGSQRTTSERQKEIVGCRGNGPKRPVESRNEEENDTQLCILVLVCSWKIRELF